MTARNYFLSASALLAAALGGMLVSGAGHARAAEITLPAETATYEPSTLPGYAVTTAMCMTCHSADYARMQPPNLPRAYWQATVAKMQKTFGAPIPDEAIAPIVDYLVKTYGAERGAAGSARAAK